MAPSDISGPKKVHFYILDSPEDEEDDGFQSTHYLKVNALRSVVTKYFDCTLHDVRFPPKTNPNAVQAYFEDALKDKGDDDAMIVYFAGVGGWNGEEYAWKFTGGYPKKEIDAYDVIRTFVRKGVDTMFLLDCYIPDRFADKWKHVANNGNVEIIARGELPQGMDDRKAHGNSHAAGFTKNLVKDITKLVERIDTPASKGGYLGFKAPLSLPMLLKDNINLYSNPRRIWIKRTKAGDKNPIARFMMMPNDIRDTRKIRCFMKTIQGPLPDKGASEGDSLFVEQEDEGFSEETVPGTTPTPPQT